MASTKLLIDALAPNAPGEERRPGTSIKPGVIRSDPDRTRHAWSVLGWVGLLFVLIGSVDIALAWYPLGFGRVEWEFGTVTTVLNGLPPVTIGLGFVLAAGLAQGRKWLIRSASAALLLGAVLILAAAALWATTVPMALQALPEGSAPLLGLKKAIARTTAQAVLYPVVFAGLAVMSWRLSGRR